MTEENWGRVEAILDRVEKFLNDRTKATYDFAQVNRRK